MGFNRRKMEDQHREAAEKEAAKRRATNARVLEDAERLIAAWNERQAEQMPMLFSPTIGGAITAGFWFLWVRRPACRTINAVDLHTLDRHPDAAVSSLTPGRRRNAGRTSSSRAWRLSESERAMRTHKHITSVTADSDFAYVQFDCGQVTVKRDGNRIILIPGPGCELASRGNLSTVEVTVSKIAQRPRPRSWAWPARSRK